MSTPIRQLIASPYGPYKDEDVLTEFCKSVPSNVLKLHGVMLECGNRPIGLTQSEAEEPGYDRKRVSQYGVYFRGVLEIHSTKWLTAKAIARLNKDIHKRNVAYCRETESRVPSASPTLQQIYAVRGMRIKVIIQCAKHFTVGYLTSKEVPNGLRIHAKDRATDPSRLSPQYLGQYRALRIMHNLVRLHAQTVDVHGESNRALVDRTPEWFVELYQTFMAKTPAARKSRCMHDSSADSDIEPQTEGQLRAGKEHTLRYVSRAEIYSLLAQHAGWILYDQRKRRQGRLIDVDVWEDWVRRSRRARQEARGLDVWWSRDIVDPSTDDGGSSSDDGPPPGAPRRRKPQPKPEASKRQPRHAAPLFRRSSDEDQRMDEDAQEAAFMRTYDPDFSPPSSPPASPSSSDELLRPHTPPNPDIMRRIPAAFRHPPTIRADFTWSCPVAECPYAINMLGLTDDNCKTIPRECVHQLRRGGWRLRDPWVQHCFFRMVSLHYEAHLDDWDIVIRKEGKRTVIAWKNPRLHDPWPPGRPFPPADAKHPGLALKQEDD
ncbi:uncharacterized protein FIBRA_09041 [Fibroporia radiculosa]|uniref:Uncharacterized protein n=1 Tax=Fibroporia radiculosa TaxID=599839 RepID=J4ICP0_9APHY|nr:uncharacterized protein FIBRA_09041 [Fibroporia radiculosa]CCM06746.1 predicted protein [Fibroporia radiculosa]